MKHTGKFRWLAGVAVLLCALGAYLAGAVTAGTEAAFASLQVTGQTVRCSVASAAGRENARILLATYNGGQMCQQYSQLLDIPAGGQEFSHTFEHSFETCKAFLLDGSTNSPICANAGQEQVRFLDHDGTLLTVDAVYTGQSALPPVSPVRAGHVFTGWAGDLDAVYGPCDVTATYVPDTSDNIFAISGSDATAGEEVTVRVSLGGTVQVCGYDMNLYYDRNVLEFVSLDSELSMDVLANHIGEDGRIKFNFGALKNRTKAGNIMDITFRVKDCTNRGTALRLEANSVICVDPEDASRFLNVDYTTCEGVIRIL